MFTLHKISYSHLNGERLFDQLDLTIAKNEKSALIGANGTGKSTLLKIIAGDIDAQGEASLPATPYYVPQLFGQYNGLTVAEALKVNDKLTGLRAILNGDGSEKNFALLQEDWTIEERCADALGHWGLHELELDTPFSTLSGGQKVKVFLAGIMIHEPELILLDEPSNHLDTKGRHLLYSLIQESKATMLIVSHDRKLLKLVKKTYELSSTGIKTYGGNYDFYAEQKTKEQLALQDSIEHAKKELRKAKATQRETAERQQKLDSRGKRKQEKSGVSRIMMNTLRNNAENSSAKSKEVHADKLKGIADELNTLRLSVDDIGQIKFGFSSLVMHYGKVLFDAKGLNPAFKGVQLWKEGLDVRITSGERIAIKGDNGSGKTTLIMAILGKHAQTSGRIFRAAVNTIYIDQEYSLINDSLTVYDQLRSFNIKLLEHELKIRLNRFLFSPDTWSKDCVNLSGGEKMRLLLCCLTVCEDAPELIVLDEPTNNLDLQNLKVLTDAIAEYKGTLVVVSHDDDFLKQIGCERTIVL